MHLSALIFSCFHNRRHVGSKTVPRRSDRKLGDARSSFSDELIKWRPVFRDTVFQPIRCTSANLENKAGVHSSCDSPQPNEELPLISFIFWMARTKESKHPSRSKGCRRTEMCCPRASSCRSATSAQGPGHCVGTGGEKDAFGCIFQLIQDSWSRVHG